MTARLDGDRPALLGGTPVRTSGAPRWPFPDSAVIAAIGRAADEGAWGHYHGPYCGRLCDLLRRRHQVDYVWLCSSGTAAVELALRGLGVGSGDEVILAAYDFKANFTDVLALGAVPVLVDLRPDDWQIDVSRIAEAISPRTRGIIVSHLHGGSVPVKRLRDISQGRIPIVEDACQCPGTSIDGAPAGASGDVGVLSFGGSKLTAAGRGGAVLTKRVEVLERIKRHVQRGNDLMPLSELQAAALIPQWQALELQNDRRGDNVARLQTQISDLRFLRMLTRPDSPRASGYYKVGFEYIPNEMGGVLREVFCLALRAEGIAFWPGFRSLHRIHARRRYLTAGSLNVADEADERIVLLHHPVLLGPAADIDEISLALRRIERYAVDLAGRQFEIPAARWNRDE